MNIDEEQIKVIDNFASRYEDVHGSGGSGGSSGSSGNDNTNDTNLPLLPFQDPNQAVVMLNITHRNQRPKSKLPGFRICGAFKNVDELKKQVKRVGGLDAYGRASLLKAETHLKFLICTDFEKKQQNPTYVMNKIAEISKKYTHMLDFHDQEFEQNKQQKKQGTTGLSNKEKIKKLTSRKELLDKKFDKESSSQSQSSSSSDETDPNVLSISSGVRKQEVAVVTIFNDMSEPVLNGIEDPEPVVIVWGCFENDTQAYHYIKNTASRYVKKSMLDVVNMYEWVYPTLIEENIDNLKEEFRHPTVNKLMKAKKQKKSEVKSYEEWLKEENMEPSVLEILSDKKTEDSVEVETRVKRTETKKSSKCSVLNPGEKFENEGDLKANMSGTAEDLQSNQITPTDMTKKHLIDPSKCAAVLDPVKYEFGIHENKLTKPQSSPIPNQSVKKQLPPVPLFNQPQSQSIPIQSQPQSQPIPIQSQSIPIQSQPIPIQSQPIPIQSQPIPIQSQSIPIQSQPIPIQSQPPIPQDSGLGFVDGGSSHPVILHAHNIIPTVSSSPPSVTIPSILEPPNIKRETRNKSKKSVK